MTYCIPKILENRSLNFSKMYLVFTPLWIIGASLIGALHVWFVAFTTCIVLLDPMLPQNQGIYECKEGLVGSQFYISIF